MMFSSTTTTTVIYVTIYCLTFTTTHARVVPVEDLNPNSNSLYYQGQRKLTDALTITELLGISAFSDLQNDDSVITLESIYSWGKGMTAQGHGDFDKDEARQIFKEKDMNRDGEITSEEWEDMSHLLITDNVVSKLFQFSVVDLDDNKEITESEYNLWANSLAKIFRNEEYGRFISTLFAQEDTNGDGVLEPSEWAKQPTTLYK